jgi:hypothetical protein
MNREQEIQDAIKRNLPKPEKIPSVQDIYGRPPPKVITGNDKK